jgi:hypothetical protein
MEIPRILRLSLLAPLPYLREDRPEPPLLTGAPGLPPGEERLLCFGADPVQGRSIEAEPETLLGPLLFQGKKLPPDAPPPETVELPPGRYFFAQARRALTREELLFMAAEVQKEALWERLRPGNRIYFRFLFEDGAAVSQTFRPVE